MNLPELYAKVVAHNPKLAVRAQSVRGKWWALVWRDVGKAVPRNAWAWEMVDYAQPDFKALSFEHEAAALIADHWTECLPVGLALIRMGGDDDGVLWAVAHDLNRMSPAYQGSTRIEALANFYLPREPR